MRYAFKKQSICGLLELFAWNRFGLIVPALLLFPRIGLANFDMQAYYAAHPASDINSFVSGFPFREYLASVKITDFQTLQSHRYFLWQRLHDGDPFLYALGEYYVRQYEPLQSSMSALSGRIDVGVSYLDPKKGFNRGTDEIYQLMGYFFLGTVGQWIEHSIAQNHFDPNEAANASLIRRLEQYRVYVNIEEAATSKIVGQIQKGNFSYLFSRLVTFLYDRRQLLLPLSGVMFISSVTLAIIAKRHLPGLILFLCICSSLVSATALTIFMIQPMPQGNAPPPLSPPTAKPQMTSTWHLIPLTQYSGVPGAADDAIRTFRTVDANQQTIGTVIWLLRPQISAQYIAYQEVYKRFKQLGQRHQVVLATTGGFTNSAAQPEGLTAEAGTIVNAVLMHDRHGLVLLHDGGIRVLNLKNKDFRLPDSKFIMPNPLESLLAYSELLKWVRQNRATMFQTQLLAFSDTITIDERRAKLQLRERRLLALARDRTSGQVEHIIFNLDTKYQLVDATREIFGTLLARNKKIEAILNLDVGTYNILELYDPSGKIVPEPHGPVDIRRATNLIVYWR